MATTKLQPLVSEMFLGSWVNVTSLIERDNGNGIRISRKPLTWAERVAPTTANWTFKNENNDLYGRNPNSQYFGLLGRNTPVRHRLLSFGDDFESRTSSNGWGNSWTIQSGTANSDFSVSSGTAKMAHTVVNSLHIITHDTGTVDHDITTDVSVAVASAATANITQWVFIRYVDTNNYLGAVLTLTTTGTVTIQLIKRVGGSLTLLGSATTVGTGHASNEIWRVRIRPKNDWYSVMTWRPASDAEPSAWQLGEEITDSVFATSTIAGLGSRFETGNTNTLPQTVTFYTFEANSYRFWGEIPSFSPTRDGTARQKYVPVTAAGLGQRLQAGTQTLASALTSTMSGIAPHDYVPFAYWTMEDQANATQLASLTGGLPVSIGSAADPASDNSLIGSLALPTMTAGANITFPIPAYTNQGRVAVQVAIKVPSEPASETTIAEFRVDRNPVTLYRVTVAPGAPASVKLYEFDSSGASLGSTSYALDGTSPGTNPSESDFFGHWAFYTLAPQESGGNVTGWFGFTVKPTTGGVNSGSVRAGTLGFLTSVKLFGGAGNSIGHLVAYNDAAFVPTVDAANNTAAMEGFAGELSGDRMIRLSRQVNIPFELIGNAADTQPCGPQPQGTYFTVMQTTADVDQGILREARDLLALEYVTLTHLLNRDSRITYTHGAGDATQDLESFQIIDDDRTVRNKVTSRRTNGSFATAEITTGPTSTAEPPDGIGTYPEDLAWNLATDAQAVPFAGWRAHKLGWDEPRYPATSVWRQRAAIADVPALNAATLSIDISDRYTITDPPTDLPPDDIELLTQGYEELLANFEHQITLDGAAAKPYNIMEIDGSDTRVTGNHALRGSVATSTTSWDVTNLDLGVQLIADDAQDGWYWMIDGELVQVTDVATPSIAFVGVGTASTGSSGSRTPGLPAGAAAGNLLLVSASTRNSGTGIPQLAANWDQIYLDGNFAIYAKVYQGTGAGEMPTITFSGGAANEDTIAQSAAFSGKFDDTDRILVRACGCLNPSAQDITFPGVPIWELPENLVAVYAGWKQDDWTSAATPAGWTEMQEAITAAGNDAAQVWGYQLFTSRPAAGSLQPLVAITGGAAAISRGVVLILASDYQTVTVTRSINGIVKGHDAGAVPVLVPAPHIGM